MPSDREAVSRATATEHEALARAMSSLERALVAPSPRPEPKWKDRVATAVAEVASAIRRHVESAEGPSGLLAQVDVAIGRCHEATLISRPSTTRMSSSAMIPTRRFCRRAPEAGGRPPRASAS